MHSNHLRDVNNVDDFLSHSQSRVESVLAAPRVVVRSLLREVLLLLLIVLRESATQVVLKG